MCSSHYLHFSFEKHIPFQVLKDFCEHLEATPSTFLSIFTLRVIYIRIDYWGSIFTLYLTWEVFNFNFYQYFP